MAGSSKFVVDPMTLADLGRVVAIDAVSFPKPSPAHESVASAELRFHEELARPWSNAWVVRDADARAIAFMVAWQVADELHVLNLATDPTQRRRGLGRLLVDTAVEFARSRKTRQILLEVRRSNQSALRLYRAAGFFVLGVRRRYYPDDEDAVEMALVLDPSTGNVVPRDDEARIDGC
jgi:ribosomal-protein-alanine N-acetyltransferase